MEEPEIVEKKPLLLICSYCYKRLNWPEVQQKVTGEQAEYDSFRTSHGICPDCLLKNHPEQYLIIQKKRRLRLKTLFIKNQFGDLK
jgi:hypothetical protein